MALIFIQTAGREHEIKGDEGEGEGDGEGEREEEREEEEEGEGEEEQILGIKHIGSSLGLSTLFTNTTS